MSKTPRGGMFSYYGGKSKIAGAFPAPNHDYIIEPFAGAAAYSLLYFDRDVTLVEKYDVVVDIWRYLQQASPKDILSLPPIVAKTKMHSDQLSEVENNLLAFCGNRGGARPYKTAGSFKGAELWWENRKKWIADNLYRIRHWRIVQGDYTLLTNTEATWFIDPPYQNGGKRYKFNEINYGNLAEWSKARMGQVIVCENSDANWLPFEPLVRTIGQKHKTMEVMWHRA